MKIDKNLIRGQDPEIELLRSQFAAVSHEGDASEAISCDALLANETIDWDHVTRVLSNDFRKFETLLFKLHFRREKELTSSQRHRVLQFLCIAYQISADVRFFNEFLHFYHDDPNDHSLWLLSLSNFLKNLNDDAYHSFPLCNTGEITKSVSDLNTHFETIRKRHCDASLRVGLLGSPTFFKSVRNRLLKAGYPVQCFFLPYHPNKKINFLLKNKFAFRLVCLLKGIDFPFSTIELGHKDPRIKDRLADANLDIGFHKLGFIIKKNIIDALKVGLINDHWAILPFIRGRSTIEYSVLLGVPLVATAHLVEEGVDSGDIISIYPFNDVERTCSTLQQVRNVVRAGRELRAVDSIEMLSRTRSATIKNETEKGLTFYSMHPLLVEYIENKILRKH